ncbi:MAG: AbrB/MazE/SpoVT family DNA-binding domain-containing protein [Archaeoglobaceae archaeon]
MYESKYENKDYSSFLVEEIIGLSSATSRYSVTLTKNVRDWLDIKPGDRVAFVERNGEIILRKS